MLQKSAWYKNVMKSQAPPDAAQIKAMIQQVFNAVAEQYGLGASHFFHKSGAHMAELLALDGTEHVLDVASGTGALAIPLASRLSQGQVTAVDLSNAMLEQAQKQANQQGLSNLNFHELDMTDLPFDDASFEHVTCAFGLFFVESMVDLLTHLVAKCKPGGNVLISGFTGNSFMPATSVTMDLLKQYGVDLPDQPLGWKRMAQAEQIKTLFAQAGINDVEVSKQSLGYYVKPEGWWEVVWNAGFRGYVAQLGDQVDNYKQALMKEIEALQDDKGLWLEVDVIYGLGSKVRNP